MGNWVHLCIDMQRMFADETPWHVPWMAKISDQVQELSARHPERTVFTRFVPPLNAQDMPGRWRDYYQKWEEMTLAKLPREAVGLVPALKRYAPPARVFDKGTYSPWSDGRLHQILAAEKVGTVIITGGETDVCVLAAVLGAIDLGYRVVVPCDAVCSGADETHDITLKLLGDRFSVQVEIVRTDELLSRLG